MKRYVTLLLVAGLALTCLSFCSRLQKPVAVESKKENVIAMKADDYKFEPNNLQTRQGDTITFKIENVSGKTHNFTIKDPQGKTVKNVDLPSKQTIEVTVPFTQTGKYDFHCDKPLHSSFGMKGQVTVTAK